MVGNSKLRDVLLMVGHINSEVFMLGNKELRDVLVVGRHVKFHWCHAVKH